MNHSNMHGSGMTGGTMHSNGMAGGSMQGGNTQGNAKNSSTPQNADSAMNEGMVKKVDKAKGAVTLAHGPMNGMPAMTMVYKVKDAAWLDQLQTGQRIRFATDPADGGMTVVKFELPK
jgi:Cu/Ag efflux protein CusF